MFSKGIFGRRGKEDLMQQKKSLIKNSFFNVLYKGFTALFPLLTTTYISRTLLPERVGLVSYANTIVIYFSTIASLGIPNYGVKEISKSGEDINTRSRTFMELFSINFVSTLFCVLLYYTLVNSLPYFQDKRPVLNMMGLLLVLNLVNVDWFYQGIEEYKIISIRGIIIKIISFALMLLFVETPDDYLIYALILCFATAGNYIYNMLLLPRYICAGKYKLEIKRHLGVVIILLASSVATEIYTALDTVMLEYYHGSSSVAFYSNATKIVRMVYTLVIAMIAPLYPRIAYYLQQGEREGSNELVNKALKIVLVLGVPAVIGLASMADQIIIILFGSEYVRSVNVLRIASILVLVFSVAYILGHVILMSSGKEEYILRATITGALINAVLNFVLIPPLMENGAILASVISEVMVTAVLVSHGKRDYRLSHDLRFFVTVVFASAVMAVIIKIVKTCIVGVLPMIVQLFLIMAIAVLAYLCMLALLKNEIMIESLRKIISKL